MIDFGRGAELEKSKIGIELAKAKLLKKEQEILYKAAEAYTGLISSKEKFGINQSNVNLLERQVETDRIRLERGNTTLSDVAQSESSLAEAKAKLQQAENDLLTSRLNYENIIGQINDTESLDKNSIFNLNLPNQLSEAIEISKKNDPDLIAKPKGGFYKSVQLLIVILITKILDWPSFFFSNTIFSPTLHEESQKVSFLIKHGHPPNSPTFLFRFI